MEIYRNKMTIETIYELGSSKSDIIKELKIIREKLVNEELSSFQITDINLFCLDKFPSELDALIYGLEFTTNVNRSGRKYKEPTMEQLNIIRENHVKWLNGHISWNDYYKLVGVANNTLKRWLKDRGYKLK